MVHSCPHLCQVDGLERFTLWSNIPLRSLSYRPFENIRQATEVRCFFRSCLAGSLFVSSAISSDFFSCPTFDSIKIWLTITDCHWFVDSLSDAPSHFHHFWLLSDRFWIAATCLDFGNFLSILDNLGHTKINKNQQKTTTTSVTSLRYVQYVFGDFWLLDFGSSGPLHVFSVFCQRTLTSPSTSRKNCVPRSPCSKTNSSWQCKSHIVTRKNQAFTIERWKKHTTKHKTQQNKYPQTCHTVTLDSLDSLDSLDALLKVISCIAAARSFFSDSWMFSSGAGGAGGKGKHGKQQLARHSRHSRHLRH